MLLLSLIGLSYVGAGVLVVGMVLLGGGLVRRAPVTTRTSRADVTA